MQPPSCATAATAVTSRPATSSVMHAVRQSTWAQVNNSQQRRSREGEARARAPAGMTLQRTSMRRHLACATRGRHAAGEADTACHGAHDLVCQGAQARVRLRQNLQERRPGELVAAGSPSTGRGEPGCALSCVHHRLDSANALQLAQAGWGGWPWRWPPTHPAAPLSATGVALLGSCYAPRPPGTARATPAAAWCWCCRAGCPGRPACRWPSGRTGAAAWPPPCACSTPRGRGW